MRRYFALSAALLLAIEIVIGLYADGWVRSYLGDVLVIPLIWCVIRTVTPKRPRYGHILPTVIVVFAFAVEFLQLLGIADILGIKDPLLRTIVGTSFSAVDLVCYVIGAVPLYAIEYMIRTRTSQKS